MDVASEKGEVIYVALQTDIDTFSMPTTSGTIFVTSSPEFEQKTINAENQEVTDSLGEEPGEFAAFEMGDWKISCNFKASGTAGVESPIHSLLLAAYGRTENTGPDVRYYHYRKDLDPIQFLSVVVKKHFETKYITGAYANTMEVKVEKGKIQTVDFSGKYKKEVRAGKANLLSDINGTTTPETTIPFETDESYKRIDVDSYVKIGTDDNSGTGFKVTAVDPATNTMTVDPAVATDQSAGAIIKGFTPVSTKAGKNITSRFAWLKINTGDAGDRNVGITDGTYKLENNFKALDEQMSDSDFNGDATTDTRKVSLNPTKYSTIEDTADPFDIQNTTDITGELNIGKTAGSSLTFTFAKLRLVESKESGSPEKKKGKTLKAHPDTGDDESVLIMK
jgi:hypothetical protein